MKVLMNQQKLLMKMVPHQELMKPARQDENGFIREREIQLGRHEVHLSKEQYSKTPQEVEDMRRIPYASAVDSLIIKQGCIVDFTMEAEYGAGYEAAKEAIWLKKFVHGLEVVPNMNLLITLYCHNSGIVANSKELCSHKRGKHIERKYHLIRKIKQRGDVIVTKIV
ncbi:gag/pol protein [Cucumis melo var. makuwa]|uniref:Gag/pol protein n=1 Tax=Cucumis melo var. makuwa TaxID=1194695 RepID=A0A5D3DVK6_CUCMM|nr:gag/pol protein [Cucumis melo var. makuwa]TYK27518.1 gag/pol protein [Cucumis melo var. makuwa]